ncbi:hypothetical protein BC629DRAFT_1555032 [Irpex lacteus]|nr:hypothetical protein BC629DRAFT_1555032 [Irpex lacteus]
MRVAKSRKLDAIYTRLLPPRPSSNSDRHNLTAVRTRYERCSIMGISSRTSRNLRCKSSFLSYLFSRTRRWLCRVPVTVTHVLSDPFLAMLGIFTPVRFVLGTLRVRPSSVFPERQLYPPGQVTSSRAHLSTRLVVDIVSRRSFSLAMYRHGVSAHYMSSSSFVHE